MRFLLDMGVSTGVAQWLGTQGHDVVHLRDRGLQKLANGTIFVLAHAEQRIILTFDLDFAEIVALSNGLIVSVVIFRLRNTRTPHVIQRLDDVLKQSADALSHGAVIAVEDARHRVRMLPIGS